MLLSSTSVNENECFDTFNPDRSTHRFSVGNDESDSSMRSSSTYNKFKGPQNSRKVRWSMITTPRNKKNECMNSKTPYPRSTLNKDIDCLNHQQITPMAAINNLCPNPFQFVSPPTPNTFASRIKKTWMNSEEQAHTFRCRISRLKHPWSNSWVDEWCIVHFGLLLFCANREPDLVIQCIPLRSVLDISVIQRKQRFRKLKETKVFSIHYRFGNAARKFNSSQTLICKSTSNQETDFIAKTLKDLHQANATLDYSQWLDQLCNKTETESLLNYYQTIAKMYCFALLSHLVSLQEQALMRFTLKVFQDRCQSHRVSKSQELTTKLKSLESEMCELKSTSVFQHEQLKKHLGIVKLSACLEQVFSKSVKLFFNAQHRLSLALYHQRTGKWLEEFQIQQYVNQHSEISSHTYKLTMNRFVSRLQFLLYWKLKSAFSSWYQCRLFHEHTESLYNSLFNHLIREVSTMKSTKRIQILYAWRQQAQQFQNQKFHCAVVMTRLLQYQKARLLRKWTSKCFARRLNLEAFVSKLGSFITCQTVMLTKMAFYDFKQWATTSVLKSTKGQLQTLVQVNTYLSHNMDFKQKEAHRFLACTTLRNAFQRVLRSHFHNLAYRIMSSSGISQSEVLPLSHAIKFQTTEGAWFMAAIVTSHLHRSFSMVFQKLRSHLQQRRIYVTVKSAYVLRSAIQHLVDYVNLKTNSDMMWVFKSLQVYSARKSLLRSLIRYHSLRNAVDCLERHRSALLISAFLSLRLSARNVRHCEEPKSSKKKKQILKDNGYMKSFFEDDVRLISPDALVKQNFQKSQPEYSSINLTLPKLALMTQPRDTDFEDTQRTNLSDHIDTFRRSHSGRIESPTMIRRCMETQCLARLNPKSSSNQQVTRDPCSEEKIRVNPMTPEVGPNLDDFLNGWLDSNNQLSVTSPVFSNSPSNKKQPNLSFSSQNLQKQHSVSDTILQPNFVQHKIPLSAREPRFMMSNLSGSTQHSMDEQETLVYKTHIISTSDESILDDCYTVSACYQSLQSLEDLMESQQYHNSSRYSDSSHTVSPRIFRTVPRIVTCT